MNLGRDRYSLPDIAQLYRGRWEIELLFREFKLTYGTHELPSSKPAVVEVLVLTSILSLVVSRGPARAPSEDRGRAWRGAYVSTAAVRSQWRHCLRTGWLDTSATIHRNFSRSCKVKPRSSSHGNCFSKRSTRRWVVVCALNRKRITARGAIRSHRRRDRYTNRYRPEPASGGTIR